MSTWFHWSMLVNSKILQTRFATKIGCFSLDLIHWRTVVLSVHKNTWLTVTVSPRTISFFSRAASRAACNSSSGTVVIFIGAMRAFPKKRKLCFYFTHGSFYSGSQKCNCNEDILGTVTEHMQLYIIKESTKVTSRNFDIFKLW